MSELNKEIGRRIKIARDRKGMSLENIASEIGVARSTVQRYEAGKIEKPKIPVVHAIANVLEVNPSWLIGKSENPLPASTVEKVTIDETALLKIFGSLNHDGKSEALKRIAELSEIPRYTKDTGLQNEKVM